MSLQHVKKQHDFYMKSVCSFRIEADKKRTTGASHTKYAMKIKDIHTKFV